MFGVTLRRGPGAVGVVPCLFCGAVFVVGCASPGPPLPPSLRLPAKATKLEAKRVGDEARLSFAVPLDTTDGERNRAGMQAAICRSVSTAAKTCAEIGRIAAAPGEVKYADLLPDALRAGPPVLLGYSVQLLNAAGRTAGSGETVFAAGGAAPPPVRGLTVTPRRGVVLIRWQPEKTPAEMEVTRRTTSTPVTAKPTRKPARPGFGGLGGGLGGGTKEDDGVVRLSGASDAGGMLDRGVRDREAYAYSAQRVQRVTLAGHALQLRGAESAPVTIAYRDVFPPAAPTGLVAVAGGGGGAPSIDLAWDASAEDGVTGYVVYRREGAEFRKLAATQVADYRDLAVSAGVQYTYRVTAKDANGNESAPGAAIQETVQP